MRGVVHPLGGRKIRPAEFATPGPKLQSTGTLDRGQFNESTRFTTVQRPVVWNHWVLDGATRTVTFRWTSPSGTVLDGTFDPHPNWDFTDAQFPGQMPLEKGRRSVAMLTPSHPELATIFTANKGRHARKSN